MLVKKIKTVEEGIIRLLTVEEYPVPEFSVREAAAGEYPGTLLYDGREIPLFESRFDQRIAPIANYGRDVGLNSALNVYSFVGSDISLEALMIREMDIAEFVLHAKICSVTAFAKPHAVNMILVMDNGTAANIDLGNTMAPGTLNQCQHRLITSKGMACDRAAGEYITQSVLSVFPSDSRAPETYEDDHFYLYGLSESESNRAVTAFSILSGRLDASGWAQDLRRYRAAVQAVYESDRLQRTVVLEQPNEAD